MMAVLLGQSLRGALAVSVVWTLDRWLAGRMRAGSRRVLWLLAALVFTVPWKIPLPPLTVNEEKYFSLPSTSAAAGETLTVSAAGTSTLSGSVPVLTVIWLSGTAACLGWLAVQTLMVSRRWSRERFCTDSRLLELLENAKRTAGVTAPIGLVVTDSVASPALMGWLRPRIFLPSALAVTLSERQLTMVLLHELAHFRKLDIPTGWLLAAVWAAHWFNPFAWLMVSGWRKFREEAADEAALAWLGAADSQAYGATLLEILRFENGRGTAIPLGSLMVGESMQNLKTRMIMIKNYRKKPVCYGLLAMLSAALMMTALVAPARAESEDDAVLKKMTAWMQLSDEGKFEKSWNETSVWFKTQISKEAWVQLCSGTRPGFGKVIKREKVNVMKMNKLPVGNNANNLREGNFIIVIFNSSFANMFAATEVVTFEKNGNSEEWEPIGYYIKPR